jgi:hypothetical protein
MHVVTSLWKWGGATSTVTGHSYLDMLEKFSVPQLPPGFIFQQDRAPPHFHRDVTTWIKIFLSYSVHCWKHKFNKAGSHVKFPLFLSDFDETWSYLDRFSRKHSNTKFHENPSGGRRRVPCGRKARQTCMTKLIDAFHNFAIAPKKITGGQSNTVRERGFRRWEFVTVTDIKQLTFDRYQITNNVTWKLLVTSSKRCIRNRKRIIGVILEKLIVSKLLNRFYSHFLEPASSLNDTGHYLKPA